MRKKPMHLLLLLVLGAVLLAAGAAVSQEIPEHVTMNSKIYGRHTKGLVTFTHKRHIDVHKIACTECHHLYEGGKNTWKQGDPVKKCASCHQATGRPEHGMSKEEKIAKFHKDAMHANCVACHRASNKAGKNAPVSCKDCHRKK